MSTYRDGRLKNNNIRIYSIYGTTQIWLLLDNTLALRIMVNFGLQSFVTI